MEQKVNYLLIEEFYFEEYEGNQIGFLTRRPDKWILAVERYCSVNDFKYIWEEKINNDGKIFEYIINIYLKPTTNVKQGVNVSNISSNIGCHFFWCIYILETFALISSNIENLISFNVAYLCANDSPTHSTFI